MKTLSEQLSDWQRSQPPEPVEERPKKYPTERPKEHVVGGDIIWQPVNKEAAKLIAKAPWWAQPPEPPAQFREPPPTPKPTQKPKPKKPMNTKQQETVVQQEQPARVPGQNYTSDAGIRIKMVNGEPMFHADDVRAVLCAEIAKLPQETRPNVRAAEDARRIMQELLQGIGGDMEKFKADTKRYMEDIRQTRFAVVTETAAMTTSLKEVRQFFLGGDYRNEIERLREFVDLCERLHKLKESGFLDNIADTMLKLSISSPA